MEWIKSSVFSPSLSSTPLICRATSYRWKGILPKHGWTRLSYEQFGAFLANIKEFNAQKQSREDTLSKAEEIFGTEHKDLYISFQNMLNRNQS
ncbi:hypothetical protein ZWY2020_013558 [Hordeum vulgare]|nr:hypothetical protein ZWY2020_013558 [Hordeum vulgare]